MSITDRFIVLATALLSLTVAFAAPVSSTFSYSGRLEDNGAPANGRYDVLAALFDAEMSGAQVGDTVTNISVVVTNGLLMTTFDFGPAVFDGSARWLELSVRTNGGSVFALLSPRQPMLAAPYAIRAANADMSLRAITADTVASNAVTGAAIQDEAITDRMIAPGQVVRTLNGLTDHVTLLAGANLTLSTNENLLTLASSSWGLAGNSGTTAGGQFLGTTDNQPLELKVNNLRALRIEAVTNGRVFNIIAGCPDNSVSDGAVGVTIAGGGADFVANQVKAQFTTIGGGAANLIDTNASSSVISGGYSNRIGFLDFDSVIAGGSFNAVLDGAFRSTIDGGSQHIIAENCYHSSIGGGWSNVIAGNSGTIGGGIQQIIGDGSRFSTIGGGAGNVIGDSSITCTIGGGGNNLIEAGSWRSTIAGGRTNVIGANSLHATIGGGTSNAILANAEGAVIPGGILNEVGGAYGLAAGRRAKAGQSGAFVWADATEADFLSSTNNEFAVRATGGVRLVTGVDVNGTPVSWAALAPGSGSWSALSDRNAKENFAPVDGAEILRKLVALPIPSWNYKTQGEDVRHLGPAAQDFSAAFHLGESDKAISAVDADGVALAAIQALAQKFEHELRRKDEEITSLKQAVADLGKEVRGAKEKQP
jgi:hypothetical protein